MKANPCLPFSGSYSCHPALSSLYNTLDILLPSFPLHANALYDDEEDDDDGGDGDGDGDKDGNDDRFDMSEDTTQHLGAVYASLPVGSSFLAQCLFFFAVLIFETFGSFWYFFDNIMEQ